MVARGKAQLALGLLLAACVAVVGNLLFAPRQDHFGQKPIRSAPGDFLNTRGWESANYVAVPWWLATRVSTIAFDDDLATLKGRSVVFPTELTNYFFPGQVPRRIESRLTSSEFFAQPSVQSAITSVDGQELLCNIEGSRTLEKCEVSIAWSLLEEQEGRIVFSVFDSSTRIYFLSSEVLKSGCESWPESEIWCPGR